MACGDESTGVALSHGGSGGSGCQGLHPPLGSPARRPCRTAARPARLAPPPARRSPGSTPPSRPPSAAHLQGSAPGRETRRALSGTPGWREPGWGVSTPTPGSPASPRPFLLGFVPPGLVSLPKLEPSCGKGGSGRGVSWLPCNCCPAHGAPRAAPSPNRLQIAPGKRCGAIAPVPPAVAPPSPGRPPGGEGGEGKDIWDGCDGMGDGVRELKNGVDVELRIKYEMEFKKKKKGK